MNDRRRPRLRNLGDLTRDRGSGQSLVEMAVLTPLLLLMLLGVLEVGWALRGYLVLSNANREATRFAARGRYLDFNKTTPEEIGYPIVVSHTLDSLAGTLPVDLQPTSTNGGMIISHYVVDTGQPCIDMDTCVCSEDPANFDAQNAGNIADWDDEFRGPGPAWDNADHWRYNSRPGELASRLDDALLRTQLTDENNIFNCNLHKKDPSAAWSINSVVAVEMFYDQPQLLGIFDTSSALGRAIIPNPIPFYSQTTMRITADARTGGRSSDGQGCCLWPIALHIDTINNRDPDTNMMEDIYNGSGAGNFGWLRWPSATSAGNEGYLVQSLYNCAMALDFEDASDSTDTVIDVGDWVWGNTGLSNSSDAQATMEWLITQDEIRVPVWDTSDGTGVGGSYHIFRIAVVRITSYHLPGQNRISAQFLRWDDEACPGNGY